MYTQLTLPFPTDAEDLQLADVFSDSSSKQKSSRIERGFQGSVFQSSAPNAPVIVDENKADNATENAIDLTLASPNQPSKRSKNISAGAIQIDLSGADKGLRGGIDCENIEEQVSTCSQQSDYY
jgi:hypothetical protein